MSEPSEDVVPKRRRWLSTREFVALLAVVALGGLLAVPASKWWGAEARKTSCQNNLRLLGQAFKMYANEAKGEFYPPLSGYATLPAEEGGFAEPLFAAPDARSIVPEYIADLNLARCPTLDEMGTWDAATSWLQARGWRGHRARQAAAREAGDEEAVNYHLTAELAQSYIYRGFGLLELQDHFAWWGATIAHPVVDHVEIAGVGDVGHKDFNLDFRGLPEPWPDWVPYPDKAKAVAPKYWHPSFPNLFRLRAGIERFFISEAAFSANATPLEWHGIPLLWEHFYTSGYMTVLNHAPGGCNVLHLDGSVEFVQFPGDFPVSHDEAYLREQARHGGW